MTSSFVQIKSEMSKTLKFSKKNTQNNLGEITNAITHMIEY